MSESSRLVEISIKNLGVIEGATLEIGEGFTVLTGETGAGKTMVLTALALVLGGKTESTLVRQGKERLATSATFLIPTDMVAAVSENGGIVEDGSLIMGRTIGADGKSRASVGGISVPASVLSTLAEPLIEIHGQAANMSITKPSKQREILDRFAGGLLTSALKDYSSEFVTYHLLKKKCAALRENSAGREREIQSLRDFATAFGKVKPNSGEFDDLSLEITRLSSVETLRLAVGESGGALEGEEVGVLDQLSKVRRNLESAQDKDPAIADILAAVSESYFLLSDASQMSNRYLSELGVDPARLEVALNRRAEISWLLKTYAHELGPDRPENQDEQIAVLNKRFSLVEETIADLDGGEDRLSEMEMELDGRGKDLLAKSEVLSTLRQAAAQKLSQLVTFEIQALAMPHTNFICTLLSPDYGGEVSLSTLTSSGADEAVMLLQSHVDGPKVPLAKGASGGEMSRVMLGLEVVLASSQPVGTYIFDEVDAGVGGKAAIEVGRRLHDLSRHAQVIVVTHLPQVAAWADSHFVLKKNNDGTVSQSDVTRVVGEDRIEELARMLAGHEDSRSAKEHAAELLSMNSGANK